jgi:lipoprotein LprG
MPRLPWLAPLLVALILSGCGGSDKSAAPSGAPSVTDVMTRAAAAARAAKAFHFSLSQTNGSLPMPLNLRLISADGDYVAPDKIKAAVKAKASSVNLAVDLIAVGDKTWITNPFTRRWTSLPGVTVADIADPPAIVTSILDGLRDPKLAGQEDVDGVKTYRITGTMDSGALVQAFGDAAKPGNKVAIEVWVGVDDNLPRRARLTGKLSNDDADNVVRQVDLSKFGSTVDIKPPE